MKPTLQYVGPAVAELYEMDGVMYVVLPVNSVSTSPAPGRPKARMEAIIFESHHDANIYAQDNGLNLYRRLPFGTYRPD